MQCAPLGIRAWIGLIVLGCGVVATAAVAQYQIAQHDEDIKELKKDKEVVIRMDERQKTMQTDLAEIKALLQEIKK